MKGKKKIGLAIHGGTGSFGIGDILPNVRDLYQNFFINLIESAYTSLESGANSIDIVEECILKMEDSCYFNAGRGSITIEGESPSMDASIMSGLDLSFGAITNISTAKNPISVARKVKELLNGYYTIKNENELLRLSKDVKIVEKAYFETEKVWLNLMSDVVSKKNSTVGCVALDKLGNLSAGTSTGGLMIKNRGRISDSSVIGAGTYANNKTCAISCSGHGETIIKTLFAHSIHSQMLNANSSLGKAIENVFDQYNNEIKHNVGLISIDLNANISVKYNSEIMFYGYKSEGLKTITSF